MTVAGRSIRALFVEDEAGLFEDYSENLKYALRDSCDVLVEFEHAGTVERAKEMLPAGRGGFQLIITDMLFPGVGGGLLSDRGREIIESASRTEGVVIVAISQGDTQHFPNLREDALSAGADIFRYKQQVVRYSASDRRSGWDDLAQEICRALERSSAPSGGTSARAVGSAGSRPARATDKRRVFLVHGRDGRLVNHLMGFLEALNLAPMEWDELVSLTITSKGEGGNPSVMSIIQTGFETAAGCVVLFTPDDEARLRGPLHSMGDPKWEFELGGQPRPNVLLEAGFALGWDISRTLIVSIGSLRSVSDLAGMHIARLDNSPGARNAVAQRLLGIGLSVETEGTRWLTTGDFAGPTM